MGIQGFTKVYKPTKTEVTLAETANQDWAVDAFLELFRSTTLQHTARLTNSKGEPTLHLTITLANAVKSKIVGSDNIWCFDSRDPRSEDDAKQRVLLNRAEIRKANLEAIKKLETKIEKLKSVSKKVDRKTLLETDPTFDVTLKALEDQYEMMKARNPDTQHFSNMIRDVQFILTKLGIRMALAPVGIDAENVAAALCIEGICDGVITTDSDSMGYGAPKMLKKCRGKSGKYDLFVLEDCLKQQKQTYKEFVETATVLGCDEAEKTPRVGPATVVKKVHNKEIEYTPQQIAGQAKFMSRKKIAYEYIENVCTNESLDELTEWLVKIQGFNRDRVEKMLKNLRT